MEHKEGLKEMITRPPFVPTKPIGRKEFFFGFLIIAIVALVFNAGLAFLLGGSNLIAAGVIALIASYIVATWYTKRFLDISRARSIGFEPEIDIQQGIKETMAWYLENRKNTGKRWDIFDQK